MNDDHITTGDIAHAFKNQAEFLAGISTRISQTPLGAIPTFSDDELNALLVMSRDLVRVIKLLNPQYTIPDTPPNDPPF